MISLKDPRLLKKGNTLVQYLKNIANSKPLSSKREVELAERIKAGDEPARLELAQANLLFVVSIAQQYRNRGLTLAELISAGNVGLMTAVDRFDGARGYKFITYAVWWIRQAIQIALVDESHLVRLPRERLELIEKVTRASRKLEQASGGVPSAEAVAAELKLEIDEAQGVISSGRPMRLLDNPILPDQEDDKTLLDMLTDESIPPADEHFLRQESYDMLERLVGALDGRERKIMRLYFGLDSGIFMNLEEIGGEMNLTRERIRQLKERALSKLHNPGFIARVLGIKRPAAKKPAVK